MGKGIKIWINIAIFAIITGFVWYMARSMRKEEKTYAGTTQDVPLNTPYKRLSSFELPEKINRFDLYDGKLFVSAGQSVYIYDTKGTQTASFPVKQDARDITAKQDTIYLLYPTFIEVYNTEGQLLREWEACSELSDYCSFTLAGDYLFVTDAENKNICKYTKDGNFVKFIKSPHHFIIPSYSFDIESRNDTIYCVNSGRHLIETYTPDGDFIAAFGGPGTETGFFAGCCNPAYISFTPDGKLLTSEKGNPRISSFERNGVFKEVLLTGRLMGGGSNAYEASACEDYLYVAGKNEITIYGYEQDK